MASSSTTAPIDGTTTHRIQAPPGDRAERKRWVDALGALALVMLMLVVAWPFLRSGGFFLDDWWLRAEAFYGTQAERQGFFDTFDGLGEVTGYRPVAVPYYALVLALVGSNSSLAVAVAFTLDVLLVLAAYGALRIARMPVLGSLTAAAALAAIPWASSTRFWMSASATTLAIALAVTGLALGALGLKASSPAGRRNLAIGSVLVLVASALTYEVTAGLIGVGFAYYAAATGRVSRHVLAKWGIDVVTLTLTLAAFRRDERSEAAPASGWLDHAEAMVRESASLVRAGAIPDGHWGTAAQLLVAVLAVALLVRIAARRARVVAAWRSGGRRDLVTAVAWAAGGGVAGLAGYLVLVPADPWYHPFQAGQGDRSNATAAVGFAVAYGATVLGFAVALTLGLRRQAAARALVAGTLAVLLVGAFAGQSHAQADRYVAAWQQSKRVVRGLESALPDGVRPGDVLLSFNSPGYIAPGFPALGESWDLNGAVRLTFETGQVRGYPILVGQPVVCGARAVELPLNAARPPIYGPAFATPYGRAVFVDAERRSARRIDSVGTCRSALGSFTPGPYFAPS